MCKPLLTFCSGLTRPVFYAGGFLALLLAIATGYTGCTLHALLGDIEPQLPTAHSALYFSQMYTAGYLALLTIYCCFTAHTDFKDLVRWLVFMSATHLILSLTIIFLLSPGQHVGDQYVDTLKQAAAKYDFTDKLPAKVAPPLAPTDGLGQVLNSSAAPRNARDVAPATPAAPPTRELTKEEATRIWDRLQARGCCGLAGNATEDWKGRAPKSCCAEPKIEGEEMRCKEADAGHKLGCLALIASTGLNQFIVILLVALLDLCLMLVAGISAYRTFRYDEASQSAYT